MDTASSASFWPTARRSASGFRRATSRSACASCARARATSASAAAACACSGFGSMVNSVWPAFTARAFVEQPLLEDAGDARAHLDFLRAGGLADVLVGDRQRARLHDERRDLRPAGSRAEPPAGALPQAASSSAAATAQARRDAARGGNGQGHGELQGRRGSASWDAAAAGLTMAATLHTFLNVCNHAGGRDLVDDAAIVVRRTRMEAAATREALLDAAQPCLPRARAWPAPRWPRSPPPPASRAAPSTGTSATRPTSSRRCASACSCRWRPRWRGRASPPRRSARRAARRRPQRAGAARDRPAARRRCSTSIFHKCEFAAEFAAVAARQQTTDSACQLNVERLLQAGGGEAASCRATPTRGSPRGA